MGRPRKTEGAVETKVRIIEAAELEFAAHGLSGARLEDIAGRVGIRRASLLHHFSSKEVLYREVIRNAYRDVKETFLSTINTRFNNCLEFIDALCSTHLAFLEKRPSVAQLALREIACGESESGYQVLLEELLPTLQGIEEFLIANAGANLRQNGSKEHLREALLMIIHGQMARVALGSKAGLVFPSEELTIELARAMVFPDGSRANCGSSVAQSE